MSAAAYLCSLTDAIEVVAPPSAGRIREIVAEMEGHGLVEPDLPIGKLALPRDAVDRAVLATITRGAPRALLFVKGASPRLARVKEERALELFVSLVFPMTGGGPLFAAAREILSERGAPMHGKELLREARARRGGANTKDAAELGKEIVRAWSNGLLSLELR